MSITMYFSFRKLALLSVLSQHVAADFLGPTYPAPLDLTSSTSLVRAAWENLTETLDGYLKGNNTPAEVADFKKVTWSTGLFSIHDSEAKQLQYHYTSPQVKKGNGTKDVDGDTIYRMASVTKLFTVLVGLLELNEEQWNTPISKIIPGLAIYDNGTAAKDDPVYTTPWDKITPWALANQQSGVARQGLPFADLLFSASLAGIDISTFGLPPLDLSVLGPCIEVDCDEADLIKSMREQPPTFAGPWVSPGYANGGFILLGIALSHLMGTPTFSAYDELIFKPLEMSSSSADPPTEASKLARSVILQGFSEGSNLTIPSGGLLSTINDLAKFGTALINSTLLSAEETRKW